MKILGKSFRINASIVIIFLLSVMMLVTLIVYFVLDNSNTKWLGLIGSFTAGLFVAIIQFIIAWQDYQQTEKLKKLKLIEILYDRASRDKYSNFIKNCNRKLDVMGVTTVRFFKDFADTSNGATENATVLLRALDRGVRVRVLLPAKKHLPVEKNSDYEEVRKKCKELQRYQNLEVRYFDHPAAHSIFRIDDTCIIGPVFPELESRNTPALYLQKSSPMALNYMDYFESEWNKVGKQDHA